MSDDDIAAVGGFIERGRRAQAAGNFEIVAAELRALGVTIAARPGEYSVNYRGGKDGTARFTDDLDQALELGRELAAMAPAAIPAHAPGSRRRQWRPKKMTPKAIRRRVIRAHNRRMRARAIKSRGDI